MALQMKVKTFSLFATVLIGSFGLQLAQAANPVDTRDYLLKFHSDPKKVMNEPLAHRDEAGNIIAQVNQAPIGARLPTTVEVAKAKNAIRASICAANPENCESRRSAKAGEFAAIGPSNAYESFLFAPPQVVSLLQMEKQSLTESVLAVPPWTDSYWPTHKGLIARRWVDPSYPDSSEWMQNYTYVQMAPAPLMPADILSPAEKYDLLVGDPAGTLTAKMWDTGKYYQDTTGAVPTWVGLCHGWSPASLMTPVPMKSLVLTSPSGTPITFYPSDIKALASLSWGEAPPKMKFAGTRCKVDKPKEDEFGRVIDESCFDVNPATWHIGIVNQMGVGKRGFVFDATYDQQVWNYPLNSYKYHYFNPQTLAVSEKMAGSMVNIADFTIDKFRKYRPPQTRYVVGIAMDVSYAIPTLPSKQAVSKSQFHTVKYVYDLELDGDGNVIGGEWYSNFHPDFIWNIPADGRALSAGEKRMSAPVAWDGSGPVPEALQQAALISSSKSQPLAAVVEAMVKLAQ